MALLPLAIAGVLASAPAGVRNDDADVIRAVLTREGLAAQDMIVLGTQLSGRERPAFGVILDDLANASDRKSLNRSPGLQTLNREILLARGAYRPPAIRPLRTLDLGPDVAVADLPGRPGSWSPRSRSLIPGHRGRRVGWCGSISPPTYSADGRYAGVRLAIAGYHPTLVRYVLRRKPGGWVLLESGMIYLC